MKPSEPLDDKSLCRKCGALPSAIMGMCYRTGCPEPSVSASPSAIAASYTVDQLEAYQSVFEEARRLAHKCGDHNTQRACEFGLEAIRRHQTALSHVASSDDAIEKARTGFDETAEITKEAWAGAGKLAGILAADRASDDYRKEAAALDASRPSTESSAGFAGTVRDLRRLGCGDFLDEDRELIQHAADLIEVLAKTPPSSTPLTGRAALIHEHDCPKAWEFFKKHALGSKLCPSCLKCGKAEPDRARWAITHMELPDIYICADCCASSAIAPTGNEVIAVDLESITADDLDNSPAWVLGVVRRAVAHLRRGQS